MKVLPQTNSRLLRVAVVGLVMGCLWFAVNYLLEAISGQSQWGALSLIVWLPLAAGLWSLREWARFLSLVILWLIIVAAPTVVGPWKAINGDAPPLPIWGQLMHSVAPVFIPAAFFIEILYAYKREFSWSRVSQAIEAADRPPTMLPRSWFLWCLGVFATPILLVALLNLDARLAGGCISPLDHGPRYSQALRAISPWVCVISGLVVFLRAAPANAGWRDRVVRSLIYIAGMLWFCSNARGYLMVYFNLCE